jgi:hypothetical protein
MKKQMFALLGLSLMLATVSAYGQTVRVKANIPFNFTVTGATLPAGTYRFSLWLRTERRWLSVIRI